MENRKKIISILVDKIHKRYPGYERFALTQFFIILAIVASVIVGIESLIFTIIINLILHGCFMVTLKQFAVAFIGLFFYYVFVKPFSDEAIEQYEKEINEI